LFRVVGRMKAPLSPSARTSGRLVRVRDKRKLLLVVNRGRSHDVIRGVSLNEVVKVRSLSTPTGIPRRKRRSAYASLPRGVESGYTRRSLVLIRSPVIPSIPRGCQFTPAEFLQR
jgi:hypothetical protein